MTTTNAPAISRPWPASRCPALVTARLLRLELRHNAMLWMLPLVFALFWLTTYRKTMAMPPLWNMRAVSLQSGAILDFIVPVARAAAWMGSREARRHTAALMTITARPRWARLLTTWVATTCWSLVGYLVCLAVLYGMTARQASWGGPLWWPAAVVAASLPAFAALGFAAGALLPAGSPPRWPPSRRSSCSRSARNSSSAASRTGRSRPWSPPPGTSDRTRAWRPFTPTFQTWPWPR